LVLEQITENKMAEVAQLILKEWPEVKILCFEGNLGAGKTTLIKYFSKLLALQDAVTSPTFAYVNTYDNAVHHFDCYRLESTQQALDMGFEEYFDDDKFVWIEWPETVLPLIKDPYLLIRIEHGAQQTRNIFIEKICP
jgi:tRNA threonylcarbamoyladenosine biosynthesis protein TsaE